MDRKHGELVIDWMYGWKSRRGKRAPFPGNGTHIHTDTERCCQGIVYCNKHLSVDTTTKMKQIGKKRGRRRTTMFCQIERKRKNEKNERHTQSCVFFMQRQRPLLHPLHFSFASFVYTLTRIGGIQSSLPRFVLALTCWKRH